MRNYLLGAALILTFAACSKKGSGPGGTSPAGTSNATVSTVAGKSSKLSSGPTGLTFDSKGNLFFCCPVGATIYKMTAAGTISLYAGSFGNFGIDNGPGATATFTNPNGLCTDKSDNMYVADFEATGIRVISPSDVVSQFSYGNSGVSIYPQVICIDPSGNLYTANESGADGIAKTTPGGVATLFAGDGTDYGDRNGPVAQAEFGYIGISGMCSDASGNIYVADNSKVKKISNGQVTTLAGSTPGYADGKGASAQFAGAMGLCADAKGNIWVADTYNNVIRMVAGDGTVTTIAGLGNSNVATNTDGNGSVATFYEPIGVAFDQNGNLFVADYGNALIRKLTFK